ncbi:hypothetical protein F5I97DRAFT_1926928 [Phlebopus sp. FC_14]|nr:hypothetical protein F5I97DRAFT_1926928 [Phlebopus sp. FC_14]
MSSEIDIVSPHQITDTSKDSPKITSAATKWKGKEKEVVPPEPSDASNSPAQEPSTNGSATLRAGRWPLEHFPPPPPDGNWKPKDGGTPATKIPPKKTGVPPSPSATLNPPLMPLTYPPPPPLSEDNPSWLTQMVGDVRRQRSHLEIQLALAQAEATEALVDVTLANTELSEEMRTMQSFLDRVAHIAGNGFVRRLVSEVDHMARHFGREEEESSDDDLEGRDDRTSNDDADEEDEDDSEETTTSDEDDADKSSSSADEVGSEPDDSNSPPHPGSDAGESSTSEPRDISKSPEREPQVEHTATAPVVESPSPTHRASESDAQPVPAVEPSAANPSLTPRQPETQAATAPSEISASSSSSADTFSTGQPDEPVSAPPAARSRESIRAEVLAQLNEPLNVSAVVSRRSRVVGPMHRIVGVQSSIDHGRERRKRTFFDSDLDSDSSEESDDANSSQEATESPKKRAKTAHQPSPSPPRKRSREVLELDDADDSKQELDSEEEVSVQVTPRAGRDDSLSQVGESSRAARKCRICGDDESVYASDGEVEDGHPGKRSVKRRRKDVPDTTPKGGWLNWFMRSSPSRQPEASTSTLAVASSSRPSRVRSSTHPGGSRSTSSSQPPAQGEASSTALVLYHERGLSAPRSPSEPNSPSSSQAVVRRHQPAPEPPASSSTTAVGRRRPRPLRRDPWRLKENAFRDPILYRVPDSP